MDGMRIACGMCPRPARLQDCKAARGVLRQYCGLPLRYLGYIAGGARNLCTLYVHHACCGHMHSMCLRYLYGGLMDGIHNMVCTLCEHVHISAACARNIAPILLGQPCNFAILRALGTSRRRCARRPQGRRICIGYTLSGCAHIMQGGYIYIYSAQIVCTSHNILQVP